MYLGGDPTKIDNLGGEKLSAMMRAYEAVNLLGQARKASAGRRAACMGFCNLGSHTY